MTVQNPFLQINDRFDQIESLITDIQSKVNAQKYESSTERLTRKEIQKQYKVSLSTVHKLMRTGDLEYQKIGRKTVFKRKDVEACFSGGGRS